eukprot:11009239-Lingulodinium_polyedra.AAC.1
MGDQSRSPGSSGLAVRTRPLRCKVLPAMVSTSAGAPRAPTPDACKYTSGLGPHALPKDAKGPSSRVCE